MNEIPPINATPSLCAMRRTIMWNLCEKLKEKAVHCENTKVLDNIIEDLKWDIKHLKDGAKNDN